MGDRRVAWHDRVLCGMIRVFRGMTGMLCRLTVVSHCVAGSSVVSAGSVTMTQDTGGVQWPY